MKKYINRLYKKDFNSYCNMIKNDLKNDKKRFTVTVNPETLMMSKKDEEVRRLLTNRAVSLVPDGIIVVKTSKWLKMPVKERITGIELMQELLNIANANSYSMYLFGAKKDILTTLVKRIKEEYPHINLLGATDGYVKNKDAIMKKIIKLKPDICLVALGIPEQEKLILKYYDKAEKGIFMGVGGSFDVLSGCKKRAPRIFIKLNLEWLYRIIKEPKRLKRFYQYNLKYLFYVIKEIIFP